MGRPVSKKTPKIIGKFNVFEICSMVYIILPASFLKFNGKNYPNLKKLDYLADVEKEPFGILVPALSLINKLERHHFSKCCKIVNIFESHCIF